MKSVTNVFLFGSLARVKEGKDHHPIQLDLEVPSPLLEVLNRLSISPQEVNLAMVNHRSVPKDWVVHPGDRLSLFPKEYPIFADWLNHRF